MKNGLIKIDLSYNILFYIYIYIIIFFKIEIEIFKIFIQIFIYNN